MLSQFQRACNRRRPFTGLCPKVTEETAGDLNKAKDFDDQKSNSPFPKPARAVPDRTEEAGHQIKGRSKTGPAPDPIELFEIVIRAGAHEFRDFCAAHLRHLGKPGFIGFDQRGLSGVVHETSVPSMTIRNKS